MKTSFKHKDKKFSLGPFIKAPHAEIIEACGYSGFDFVVLDMEHTPLTVDKLYPLICVSQLRDIEAVVRIPSNVECYFKWCLDQGVRYIQVPHIQSVEDAKNAIKNMFFFPIGERGLCRFVRDAEFSNLEKDKYLEKANKMNNLILQIEGEKGVACFDELLELDNVTYLFIGPYDLSQSLGVPGDIWNEKVVNHIKEMISKATAKDKKIGIFTDTSDGIEFWANLGVEMIQYGSDLNIFMAGAKRITSKF